MDVAVLLRDPGNDKIVRLSIPDMSGELFASHWETRCCTTAFADLVEEIGGCLLFLHPEKLVETQWIADANTTLAGWIGDDAAEVKDEEEPTAGSSWTARTAPTQVQMVELLQFMAELTGRQLKLALIVSAWDLVSENVTPAQWVQDRLPLLWQFITANPALYSASFMGVSAQGGTRSDASLLDHHIASHRIRINSPGGNDNDITHPIRWLMSPIDFV